MYNYRYVYTTVPYHVWTIYCSNSNPNLHRTVIRFELTARATSARAREMSSSKHAGDGPEYKEAAPAVGTQSYKASGRPGGPVPTFLAAVVIGAIMGALARAVHLAYHHMGEWKFDRIYEALGKEDYAESTSEVLSAFAVAVGIMSLFTLGAAAFGLWDKTAQGSGLPSIIAMLNGMNLPAVVSLKSLVATCCGICFSIASGLTVGPEGPMIHVGAAVGKQVMVHLFPPRLFPGFNSNPVVMRTMVAVGAGAGVAAAFKAPFAGVMFVVEELASSMMSVQLVVAALVANTAAYFTVFWLEKAQENGPVKVEFQVDYGDSIGCGYKFVDIFAVVPLAVALGLWGALFNSANVRLGLWRKKWLGGKPKAHVAKRLAELFCIVLLSAAVFTVVPTAFECKSTKVKDLLHHDEIARIQAGARLQCVEVDVYTQFLRRVEHLTLSEAGLEAAGEGGSSEGAAENATEGGARRRRRRQLAEEEESAQVWVFHESAQEVPLGGLEVLKHYGCHQTNADGEYEFYNPIASLFLQPGAEAARVLFEHGVPKLLPATELIVAFFVFSVLSCLCAGSAIPSGLVIPHILIGACLGRLWGLALNYMDDFNTTVGDPGIYALVGAAAMLAGSGRVPLFFSAVLVEITNDREFIPPLVLGTFVAMLVGNRFNHGYYHSLIHMNHLPILEDEPEPAQEKLSVADVMGAPVVTLSADAPLNASTTLEGLLGCEMKDPKVQHAAFAVVDSAGTLVGLADAADIATAVASGKDGLSVMDATDVHVASVRAAQPVAFAFTMYRKLGQRHVPVVDADNRPVGMITRHDLDGHKAEHLVHHAGKGKAIRCVRAWGADEGGSNRVTPFNPA